MELKFLDDRLQVIFNDPRDKAFLKHNLHTDETGRVFAKLKADDGGMFEDSHPIVEIFPYLGKEDRHIRRNEADKMRGMDSTRYVPYQKIDPR